MHFKVRATTKFSKARLRRAGSAPRTGLAKTRHQIFEAYCSKKSVARDHVRFLFDGQRINPESTPSEARRREPAAAFLTRPRAAQLEMEDGDSIDAMARAAARCGRAASAREGGLRRSCLTRFPVPSTQMEQVGGAV